MKYAKDIIGCCVILLVALLVMFFSSPRWKHTNEVSMLEHFARSGDVDRIERLLRERKIDVQGDNAALLICTRSNNARIVKLLLDYGANPNIQDENGFSPLMYAAQNTNEQLVVSLINNGATVTLTNKYGY